MLDGAVYRAELTATRGRRGRRGADRRESGDAGGKQRCRQQAGKRTSKRGPKSHVPSFPECGSPMQSGYDGRSFGEIQMNVRVSHTADRGVLWQRNSDWSRRRATPTPSAGAGGTV